MKTLNRKILFGVGILLLFNNIHVCAQSDILVRSNPAELAGKIEVLKQIDMINFIEEPVFYVQAESLVNDTVNLAQANEMIKNIPIKKTVRFEPGQLQNLLPEILTIYPDGDLEVDYDSFIPLLLKAYQDQQEMILGLQQRITQLESTRQ